MRKPKPMQVRKQEPSEGFNGAVIVEASVRLSATRHENRSLRCRPGTFEWRYGRKTAESALYHAGIKFADMWEQSGTSAAASPNLASAGGGQWKGIQDSRLEAMDRIKALRQSEHITKFGMSRLVDYCVMGTPASEIADKWGDDPRAMANVLHEDLKAVARYLGYL